MIEMPQRLVDIALGTKKVEKVDDASKEKASAPALYESDAPPPPPDFMAATNASTPAQWGPGDSVNGPVRLQVLMWEPAAGATGDMPLTPQGGVGPQTPRA